MDLLFKIKNKKNFYLERFHNKLIFTENGNYFDLLQLNYIKNKIRNLNKKFEVEIYKIKKLDDGEADDKEDLYNE